MAESSSDRQAAEVLEGTGLLPARFHPGDQGRLRDQALGRGSCSLQQEEWKKESALGLDDVGSKRDDGISGVARGGSTLILQVAQCAV